MTLYDFHDRGFSFVSELKYPVADGRGIDSTMILKKAHYAKDGRNGSKYFISAHYKKQDMWGEPVPLPRVK